LEILWVISVAVLLWLVFRFVRSKFHPREPAEAVGDQDPFAGVRSPNKRGPWGRSGAVAMAEPDEGEEVQPYPPRMG
jgi:threonine/homoserine/homoserine lactone efflux protein